MSIKAAWDATDGRVAIAQWGGEDSDASRQLPRIDFGDAIDGPCDAMSDATLDAMEDATRDA